MTQIIDLAKQFYDVSFGIFSTKKGTSTFPEFGMDLSLLDSNYIFKRDIYYEFRTQDPKYSKNDLISSGGIYRIKINSKKRIESDINLKSVFVDAGERPVCLVYQKKVINQNEWRGGEGVVYFAMSKLEKVLYKI